MDPNAALAELRAAMRQLENSRQLLGKEADLDALWKAIVAADRLAESVEALDGWLSRGGFLPDAWAATMPGDCPQCNSHDDDLSARGGICESCYQDAIS